MSKTINSNEININPNSLSVKNTLTSIIEQSLIESALNCENSENRSNILNILFNHYIPHQTMLQVYTIILEILGTGQNLPEEFVEAVGKLTTSYDMQKNNESKTINSETHEITIESELDNLSLNSDTINKELLKAAHECWKLENQDFIKQNIVNASLNILPEIMNCITIAQTNRNDISSELVEMFINLIQTNIDNKQIANITQNLSDIDDDIIILPEPQPDAQPVNQNDHYNSSINHYSDFLKELSENCYKEENQDLLIKVLNNPNIDKNLKEILVQEIIVTSNSHYVNPEFVEIAMETILPSAFKNIQSIKTTNDIELQDMSSMDNSLKATSNNASLEKHNITDHMLQLLENVQELEVREQINQILPQINSISMEDNHNLICKISNIIDNNNYGDLFIFLQNIMSELQGDHNLYDI